MFYGNDNFMDFWFTNNIIDVTKNIERLNINFNKYHEERTKELAEEEMDELEEAPVKTKLVRYNKSKPKLNPYVKYVCVKRKK